MYRKNVTTKVDSDLNNGNKSKIIPELSLHFHTLMVIDNAFEKFCLQKKKIKLIFNHDIHGILGIR